MKKALTAFLLAAYLVTSGMVLAQDQNEKVTVPKSILEASGREKRRGRK